MAGSVALDPDPHQAVPVSRRPLPVADAARRWRAGELEGTTTRLAAAAELGERHDDGELTLGFRWLRR